LIVLRKLPGGLLWRPSTSILADVVDLRKLQDEGRPVEAASSSLTCAFPASLPFDVSPALDILSYDCGSRPISRAHLPCPGSM
jgi:hypothetical protein